MGKDSSEIRREIEETRARMGDTVEALGYKADVPSRVKDAVNERVETVKGTVADVVDSVKDTLGGASGKVGSALGSATRTVSSTVSETTGKVQNATSNVRDNVQNTLGNTVGNMTERLPRPNQLGDVARRGVGIAAENPLGLVLGGLAAGFLAGLIVPVTDLEREKVGPLRDDLLDRAKSAGNDALEHGKQMVQDAAQAAIGAAMQQNAGGASSTGSSNVRSDTLDLGAPGTASP